MKKPEPPTFIEQTFATEQLVKEQSEVRYDIKDFTVEILVHKFSKGELFIPPYQRKYVWDETRKSKFIESVLLGIPIPFLFGAEGKDGRIEIVDGSQRIQTLKSFIDGTLVLTDLKKLDMCTGFSLNDFDTSQVLKFKNRVIRLVVLDSSADIHLRFQLFERINTTPLKLEFSEIRKAVFHGPFYDLVQKCASNPTFVALTPMGSVKDKRGERDELALRFFAYSTSYKLFTHDVSRFLDDFVVKMNLQTSTDLSLLKTFEESFVAMINFVEAFFPYGFAKSKGYKLTPRVRFEAIAVGVFLAQKEDTELEPGDLSWLESEMFESLVRTDASNSGPKLRSRIEFVRNALLNNSK